MRERERCKVKILVASVGYNLIKYNNNFKDIIQSQVVIYD